MIYTAESIGFMPSRSDHQYHASLSRLSESPKSTFKVKQFSYSPVQKSINTAGNSECKPLVQSSNTPLPWELFGD